MKFNHALINEKFNSLAEIEDDIKHSIFINKKRKIIDGLLDELEYYNIDNVYIVGEFLYKNKIPNIIEIQVNMNNDQLEEIFENKIFEKFFYDDIIYYIKTENQTFRYKNYYWSATVDNDKDIILYERKHSYY